GLAPVEEAVPWSRCARRRGRFVRRHGRRLRRLPRRFRRPLAEALDLAPGVDNPLRARVEGMARGADLGLELFLGRAGREGVSTDAGDDRVFVIGGMDLCLHSLSAILSIWRVCQPKL